jgi:hypothetical protein
MAAAAGALTDRHPADTGIRISRAMAQEDQMLHEHREAFNGFVKYGTVFTALVAVVLILMALTLL